MKPLKLFWARGTGRDHGIRNAGDWYSPLICERLGRRPVVYAPPHQCDLVAAGSLLKRLNRSHRLHRLGFRRKLHIWGTGSLRPDDHLRGLHHVHAARGRLTLDRLDHHSGNIPLGDPGLLAHLLIDQPIAKRHALGIIPHVIDRDAPEVGAFLRTHRDAIMIDPGAPVRDVLQQIAACERVVSSSLHGLAFADAFGVPNAWITISDRLVGGRHKFDDYYSAFGLSLDPTPLEQVVLRGVEGPYARPGIEAIKALLVASFPFR